MSKWYRVWTLVTGKQVKQYSHQVVVHQGEIYLIDAAGLSSDSSDRKGGSAASMSYPCAA
jgi:hypothetical protein